MTPRCHPERSRGPGRAACLLALALLSLDRPAVAAVETPPSVPELTERYLERYFATFPSQATAAGRHDRDGALEDLDRTARAAWIEVNRTTASALRQALIRPDLSFEDRLDAELLLRQAETELFDWETWRRPERDPLFWTGILGNATVFLLVRDDRPLEERLMNAVRRARELPRLAKQARKALAGTDAKEIAPELCHLAAGQAKASARFYRTGFAGAAGSNAELAARLTVAGGDAARALDELGRFLEARAAKASGSPRLGAQHYAARFRIVTGIETPIEQVQAEAEAALAVNRRDTAALGRRLWSEILPGVEAPRDDRELLRRLFDRVAADRARSVEELIDDYRLQVAGAITFVRERQLMTLPDPLTLHTDRSPSYFVGQSVGGVYPAGPYSPEGKTLWFLPTPSDSASPEERDAFFRDFNHHFNVMITPHEIVPGHYVQLKLAARHPHKVRALFADGVYVEGWGTFCERLMLDLGWGGPLDRLAHLKKRLENIARTIVDIRVHSQGMTREDVLRFVREDAVQDEQFAANMWVRAITTAPQLTSYHLGYEQVSRLYEDVRAAQRESFELRRFLDGMMELGPVPVEHYRARMMGRPTSPSE